MYDEYERSVEKSSFVEYEDEDALVCWVDLLGVRGMSHDQLSATVERMIDIASEASATGPIIDENEKDVFVGTSNRAVQYAVVGDAIIFVSKHQPKTPAASKLALLWRAVRLSRLLSISGYVHRGAITRGAVKCILRDGNPIITGEAVVRAYSLEGAIRATGLYYDADVESFIGERLGQMKKKALIYSGDDLSDLSLGEGIVGMLLDIDSGMERWEESLLLQDKKLSHEYVTASLDFIKKVN